MNILTYFWYSVQCTANGLRITTYKCTCWLPHPSPTAQPGCHWPSASNATIISGNVTPFPAGAPRDAPLTAFRQRWIPVILPVMPIVMVVRRDPHRTPSPRGGHQPALPGIPVICYTYRCLTKRLSSYPPLHCTNYEMSLKGILSDKSKHWHLRVHLPASIVPNRFPDCALNRVQLSFKGHFIRYPKKHSWFCYWPRSTRLYVPSRIIFSLCKYWIGLG